MHMVTIKLPRTVAGIVMEAPDGLRIVRIISRDDDTVIELEAPKPDLRVNEYEKALAEAGKRIHAIKMYRERTGVGLKDSKDAIDLAAPVPPSFDRF